MATEHFDLPAIQSEFFEEQIEEQNDIADYLLGIVAGRDREPLDRSKSAAWQRGWALMICFEV